MNNVAIPHFYGQSGLFYGVGHYYSETTLTTTPDTVTVATVFVADATPIATVFMPEPVTVSTAFTAEGNPLTVTFTPIQR